SRSEMMPSTAAPSSLTTSAPTACRRSSATAVAIRASAAIVVTLRPLLRKIASTFMPASFALPTRPRLLCCAPRRRLTPSLRRPYKISLKPRGPKRMIVQRTILRYPAQNIAGGPHDRTHQDQRPDQRRRADLARRPRRLEKGRLHD